MKLFSDYLRNESGATAIEYGLLAALIGIAIIAGATTIRDGINGLFSNSNGKLTKALTK